MLNCFHSSISFSVKYPNYLLTPSRALSQVRPSMELKNVVSKIQSLYPPRLAEKWDNTGLLVQPTKPKSIRKIFLTIDLTEKVLEEAIQHNTDFILSYHPPIFQAFKKLTTSGAKDRIIIRSIEEKIAIYSPHTSVDSQHGGVNDWLAEGLGDGDVKVLQPFIQLEDSQSYKAVVSIQKQHTNHLIQELTKIFGDSFKYDLSVITQGSSEFQRLETYASKSKLRSVADAIETISKSSSLDIYSLEGIPVKGTGQGRLVTLKSKISIDELVARIKKRLELSQVRLALGDSTTRESHVQTIALCAGAGGDVISKSKADVYWTGEMRHHDVLDAISKGTSCVLCEHSNTERGYLKAMKEKLDAILEGLVEVEISKEDRDPLVIV